tara:strand:+ start:554 stop:724 length:171 start_codon:yes stop_codon:yes gene_type:complete
MIKRLIDFFTHKTLIARIEALEILAHPKCGLDGFDGYAPLIKRLEIVEEKTKENDS